MIFSRKNLNQLVPAFVALDILMLPYLGVGILTFSMPIVVCWFLKFCLIYGLRRRDFQVGIFIIIVSFLSFLYLLFTAEGTARLDGESVRVFNIALVNFGLFSLCIIYYLYFRYNYQFNEFKLSNLLLYYFCFNLILVIIFYFDHQLFFKTREIWTLGSSSLDVGDFSSITRFTGIMSDPNNAAVAMVATLSMILLHKDLTFLVRYLLSFAIILIVVASMSKSGLLAFVFFGLFYFSHLVKLKINITKLLAGVIILIVASSAVLPYYNELQVTTFFLERVETSTLNDGRLLKFDYYLDPSNLINHIFYGQGGVVLIDGDIDRPHFGFFYIFYNYGSIALIGFLYLFFKKRNTVSYIYHLPIYVLFIGFFINTGLQDYRFLTLLALLAGVIGQPNFTNTTLKEFPKIL